MQPVVMLMGGRISPVDECLAVFLRQAGGAGARVAILPTACDNPQVVHAYAKGLLLLGLRHSPFILPIWERAQAEDRILLRILSHINGLLILGGDIARLLSVVQGSRLHHALQQAINNGAVIAGISAGAAALGTIVLYSVLRLDVPGYWRPGLGLLSNTIIVPHFRQRRRQMILMRVLMQFPAWVGLGIDEATAALINGEGIHSIGSGWVTLMATDALPLHQLGRSLPWMIHLHPGQSLTWDAVPVQSLPMIIDNRKPCRRLPPVTGAADVMFHFFKQ